MQYDVQVYHKKKKIRAGISLGFYNGSNNTSGNTGSSSAIQGILLKKRHYASSN
jgi:hypothetical protein